MSNEDSKDLVELRYDNLSEKSFAVFGDREKFEESVRGIGGKWNPRVKPAGGWVINKTNKRALDALIRRIKTGDSKVADQKPDVADMLSQSQKGIPLQSKNISDGISINNKKYKTKREKTTKVENSHTDSVNSAEKSDKKQEITHDSQNSHTDSVNSAEKSDKKQEITHDSQNSHTDSVNSAAKSDKKQEITQNSQNSRTDSVNSAAKSDKKQEITQNSQKDSGKSDKKQEITHDFDEDAEKTDEDPEKTDEDPEKTDEDAEKTDEDPEKTDEDDEDDEDAEKTDEDAEKTDEDADEDDEDPEKDDEEDNLPIEKPGLAFDKRIGNPEEKLLVQRRNKFITDYVNSDDDIDAEESKIMLNRFKNYFTYYKTYARSPEKFDNTKTKESRKKYNLQ